MQQLRGLAKRLERYCVSLKPVHLSQQTAHGSAPCSLVPAGHTALCPLDTQPAILCIAQGTASNYSIQVLQESRRCTRKIKTLLSGGALLRLKELVQSVHLLSSVQQLAAAHLAQCPVHSFCQKGQECAPPLTLTSTTAFC